MAKERSPNYPAIGLSVAVDATKTLYDKEKRTAVPAVVAAKALGYKSLSGPARVKISSLKKYGLLAGDERSGLRVSDLALRILFPADSSDAESARTEAAFAVELFKTLHQNFSEASDDAIQSYLITRLKFGQVGAKQVLAAFRDTMAYAQLRASDVPLSVLKAAAEIEGKKSPPVRRELVLDFDPFARRPPVKVFTCPLSKGVTAEVKFTGGELQKAHFETLVKYLELIKEALETEDVDPVMQRGQTDMTGV
ncbi:MAG: hypothetical protein WAQ52_02380 [Terriglobales bacterium]